jgi:hypothetical protein
LTNNDIYKALGFLLEAQIAGELDDTAKHIGDGGCAACDVSEIDVVRISVELCVLVAAEGSVQNRGNVAS